jgi:anti-sigma factor RsiW
MHSSEADLLALVDGELDPERAESVREHLAACPECAAQKARLESLVEQNRVALESLETSFESGRAPSTTVDEIIQRARFRQGRVARRASPFLKAASITIILAAVAAAAIPGSPVRDAAVRFVENLRSRAEPAREAASATAVAVRPAGRLVVAFATAQDEGVIEVVLAPTDTARVEASDPTISFSVASDSIAIDNAGSKASYVVTLPEALPSAEIRIRGVTVFRKTGESGPRTTIPFASIE